MDLDDLLRSVALPEISVDTDRALTRTLQRGTVRAHRRRTSAVFAGALLAVGLLATALKLADGDQPQRVATGPATTTRQPVGDPAFWMVDPASAPSPGASTFAAEVSRLGCNGGVTGDVRRPQVTFGNTKVVITFAVGPTAGSHLGESTTAACPTNNRVSYKVDLGQPLGHRALVDGSCASGEPAERTSSCTKDHGVRWRPPTAAPAQSPHTLAGTMELVGGPFGARPQPAPGTVSATNDRGELVATATTDQLGRFKMDLPAGSYRVTGRSPKYQNGRGSCATESNIAVNRHAVGGVVVACSMR